MAIRGLPKTPVSFRMHYRAQAIVKSPKFEMFRKQFNSHFDGHNLPIPPEGFKKIKEYHDWEKQLYKQELSPDHYTLIKEYLLDIGLSKSSEEFKKMPDYFVFELCFHATPDPAEREGLSVDRYYNPKTHEDELIVRVPVTTTEKDWIRFWKVLKPWLSSQPGYRGKAKKWDGFERDVELYYLYLRIRQNKNLEGLNLNENSKEYVKKLTSAIAIMREYREYEEIKKKYSKEKNLKDFTDKRLYEIIKRCNAVFSDLKFLQ